MAGQHTHTDRGAKPEAEEQRSSAAEKIGRVAILALIVLLCSASCGFMLLLDPRTLAVDSVYQGF